MEIKPPSNLRPTADRGPRLLLDLSTSLAWRGRHAVGIVRTEREIAARLLADRDITVIPVVFHDQSFRALEPDFARALVAHQPPVGPPATREAAGARPAAVEPGRPAPPPAPELPWHARMIRPLGRLARFLARQLIDLILERSREEVRMSLIHARQAFRNLLYGPPKPPPAPAPVIVAVEPASIPSDIPPNLSLRVFPCATDVLFLGGLGWDVIDWRRLAALREETGLAIVSVVYDLIPILFPEFLGGPGDYFCNYFLHTIDNCEKLFCISERTRADLEHFIAANGRAPIPNEVIYLGANLPAAPEPMEIHDPDVRARLARGRFALAVGTFEIRKNYALLLDLWEDLRDEPEFDLDLVIVGMPGWRVDHDIARLETAPGFGTRLHWFKRLSDAGLSWLYERCHVSLFPSLYEGWGLPVVEALQHGRPVIASNRGAIPEAGLGVATILDPDDRAAWRAALLEICRAPRQTVTLDARAFPDWDATAAAVKRGIRELRRIPVAA